MNEKYRIARYETNLTAVWHLVRCGDACRKCFVNIKLNMKHCRVIGTVQKTLAMRVNSQDRK